MIKIRTCSSTGTRGEPNPGTICVVYGRDVATTLTHLTAAGFYHPSLMARQPAGKPIEEAAECKLRAAVADEEDVFSLTALAQLLADVGRVDEAVVLFEKALECDTISTNGLPCGETRGLAMGWLAALVEGRGSEGAARAERLYEGALEANEEDALSMGNYAVFLHRIKRDHTVSLGYAYLVKKIIQSTYVVK